ncbi:hypothetical protein [Roseibium sp. MMSF_3412]|uniref:hypothetical protein n=1 Tax=Roseibium sp. MMSF_3412 TaxID=3046712 RepID=UPI00273ED4EC|nr:hypothetical protein [Roseibium sp. MMSF_3412]
MKAARLAALTTGVGLVFLSTAALAQNISCTCRYKGSDYGVGESICLKSPDGMKMATCSMVLNNTSWKFSNAPCPLSQLKPENGKAPQSNALGPADGTFPILTGDAEEELG